MLKKMKHCVIVGLIAVVCALGFAAPAVADYFEAHLVPWQGKTWVAAGHKHGWAASYYVEVAHDSPSGGHFWVDNERGEFIGEGMDVYPSESKWGAYQGPGRRYNGYATLFGREFGMGPFYDHVKGWQNLNG